MPDTQHSLVTNTTPLITLAVATGSLEILRSLYAQVVVPFEVAEEILAGGMDAPGVAAFEHADWLTRCTTPCTLPAYLRNTLDRGEAAVIQTAEEMGIARVCIDEAIGRRVARLSGLQLTGSIGILVKAVKQGYPVSIPDALERMRNHGIWLGDSVIRFALAHTTTH